MELLLTSKTPIPQVEPISIQDTEIAEQFRNNRTMIDMYTVSRIDKLGIPGNYLDIALKSLGDNIYAAVSLGDIDALKVEMVWITGLMQHHMVDSTTFKPLITPMHFQLKSNGTIRKWDY